MVDMAGARLVVSVYGRTRSAPMSVYEWGSGKVNGCVWEGLDWVLAAIAQGAIATIEPMPVGIGPGQPGG
jgi:hypothetical protein